MKELRELKSHGLEKIEDTGRDNIVVFNVFQALERLMHEKRLQDR